MKKVTQAKSSKTGQNCHTGRAYRAGTEHEMVLYANVSTSEPRNACVPSVNTRGRLRSVRNRTG